jgi:hypothetical protein
MKLKMILAIIMLLGSLDFTSAKKFHKSTFKVAKKKTIKSHSKKHRLVPSLPVLNVAAPYN